MTAPKPPAAPSLTFTDSLIILAFIAAGVIAGFIGGCYAARPNVAVVQAEVAHLRADSTSLAHRLDSLAKVARVDTVKTGIAQTSYDSLKARYASLQREHAVPIPARPAGGASPEPTAKEVPLATAHPDTTPVTVPQVFAACDTLTNALRQALTDCGAQQAVLRAQAAVSDSEARAYAKIAPDWLQRKEGAVVGLTAALALIVGLVVGRK